MAFAHRRILQNNQQGQSLTEIVNLFSGTLKDRPFSGFQLFGQTIHLSDGHQRIGNCLLRMVS